MDQIDYNVILQDYLDELATIRTEFKKTFSKVADNSIDIEKFRSRIEQREVTMQNYYDINGYLNGPNPNEPQIISKIEKEVKSAINKCEDSKARLKHLKLIVETKINKMDTEALVWDPEARQLLEKGEDPNNPDVLYRNFRIPEKRKRPTGTRRKPPRGQRDKIQLRNPETGQFMTEHFINEVSEDDDRLYCFCNRESFGDMIACDGENCTFEWFHYECVGLTEPPKGSWVCDSCQNNLEIG